MSYSMSYYFIMLGIFLPARMIGCRVVSLTVNDAKCLSGDIGCGGVEV